MLEDFDDNLDTSAFLDELDGTSAKKSVSSNVERRFLGMTAVQRFFISILLFGTVCIIGFLSLMVLESINPPFF